MTCIKNELRIVRGNAFAVRLTIEARRLDGTVIDDFDLSQAEATLNVLHAGKKTVSTFTVTGNDATIAFDGTQGLGWYGLEMAGTYQGSPWRWCVNEIFQIVETNAKANVPSWTILADTTYLVDGVLTIASATDAVQADWNETNPQSASYIKNKPAVVSPTQLQQAVGAEETRAKTAERANADAIGAEENRAKAAERVNADAIAAKYAKPSDGIPSTDMTEAVQTSLQKADSAAPQSTTYTKDEVQQLIAPFITKSVDDLVNYYLKSEVYTQSEVQQLIAAVSQFRYQLAQTLPTASADTMGIIYLVPSTNPKQSNVKDEYITILDGAAYKWEQIGTTTVDLSGYYTSAQTDQAISNALTSALSNYSTTAQMNTAITTALNNALVNYSTTTQMNAAIAAALAPYYTKTEIDTLLGNKADIDGNYPQLVAGNVVGEFNQEAEVSFRPSAGTVDIQSGYKVNYGGHLEGVKGNTVSWNQLYDSAVPTAVTGHKYYCRENNSGTIRTAIVLSADLATWFTEGSTERNVCDLSITYSINNEPSVVADFEADYFKWFGKPLSFEAYNAGELIAVNMAGLKTVGFNQYNGQPLTLVPGKVYQITGTYTSIAIDGETITPDSNGKFTATNGGILTVTGGGADTCVHFVHSGARDGQYEPYWDFLLNFAISNVYGKVNGEGSLVQIFPDGLKKVGSVRDELIIIGGAAKAIKRIGSVLTTSLAWLSPGPSYVNTYYSSSFACKELSDCLCNVYLSGAAGNTDAAFIGTDMTIRVGSDKRIYLKDSGKASRGGVLAGTIFYELAEQVEYTGLVYRINGVDYPLDGPLPYKVDDYGTEEVVAISGEKTVAPILQLRYGINVGDTIRNLPFNYLSPKMQQTFTDAEQRQARKNIGAQGMTDVLALIRANEDALLTALKTAGKITDYTIDADADANGVFPVNVS